MKPRSQAYSFVLLLLTCLIRVNAGYAQAYTEGFNDITTLPGSGWFIQNNSGPTGVNTWFQGSAPSSTPVPGPFDAYAGAVNSFIGVNYASVLSSGTISSWLITPNRTLRNGDVLTFYTRKPTITAGLTDFPDRLEVRMSTNGASTNPGTTTTGVGDFTTLLLSVNPTLVVGGYPQTWTLYTITISGLPAPTSGRIAFRYFVTAGGPSGSNSDYIGIDEVTYTPYVCATIDVSPTSLPNGTAGTAYSESMSQTGALGTPSFAITAGALPPGLTLSASGTVSGMPTATGTFNFTVTASDASGCSGSRSLSITTVCPPNPISFTAPPDICSNAAPIELNMATPAGGTYSGTGVSDGYFDPAAGTQTVTYDYTDPYGCAFNSSVTITVLDAGTSQAMPSAQSGCSGASITTIALTNTVPGATFNWTRDNTTEVTGIAASGSGDISGVLVNTTASQVTVTFTITSTVNGCTSAPFTATVEVKNEALVTSPTTLSQTICSGNNITTIALAGSAGVTAFNWLRDNTASVTGIAASGSGDISGALTNTTSAPVNVTFTVTPVAGTCNGTPTDFTITVNSQPSVTAVSVPLDGTYHGNDILSFKVDYTEDVFIHITGGIPFIPVTLNTGGTVHANYVSGSGSSSLIFQYTVSATDQDPDGITTGSSLNLNGATLQSIHGCNSIITLNNTAPVSGIKIHNPVAQTITFNGTLAKTYGDADFNPGATTSSGLTITYTSNDHDVADIVGGQVHIVGVGTATITASQAGDGDYLTATPIGHVLVVSPKNIVIVTQPKSKVYGEAEPALTYTYSPALIPGDAFSGLLNRATGENAGVYAINQGTLALSSNYAVSYTGNTLTVTEKPITVTAAAKSKVYGSADPALTYTVSAALVDGDAFSGLLNRATGENAGVYAINQGTLALSNNYVLSYTSNNLTVTEKPITVIAETKSKVYGSADPAFTYTVSAALVDGDAFTGSLRRATGENAGVYAINQGTLALSSNYVLSYTSNNLTVTGKSITVTAEAKSKVYGDADPALTYTISPVLVAGDAFTGSLGRAAGENAGSYSIAQNTLVLNSNYLLNYVPANLEIAKAVLTATASDKTMCPGDAATPPPVSYTGFKNNDNVSSLSSEPVVNIPSNRAAGNYPLTLSLGSATNYSFSYVSGQLTVLPAPSGNITQSQVGAGIYQLIAPTGNSYAWGRGETTNAITVRAAGNYSVTVTNQQGCSNLFNLQVSIQTISIPNTFSPNGDGINDYWTIPELANYQQAYVTVVNRDGQVVFESRNFTRWDGKNAGRELPAGVYFYRVSKTTGDVPVTGWLNLVK